MEWQRSHHEGVDPRGVGAVVIGRNEGERLRRCLQSLVTECRHVVYVDSGSTDGSVAEARRHGAEVVELDMSLPFTAARARNAGLQRLLERWPALGYVQVVDGDCRLVEGWVDAALAEFAANPRLGVVCGRRREIHPEASAYNRLADMEWDAPVGDVHSCGGDAVARVQALVEVGGYDEQLIAGEEPELCARLRARGWGIRRVARDMTLHDAAMTRFGQWWRRAMRSGHGFAQVGARAPPLYRRELQSSLIWGLFLPVACLVSFPLIGRAAPALLLLAYPLQWLRIAVRRRAGGDPFRAAALYATFCIAGKLPEVLGALKYWRDRGLGRRSRIIEYK